MRRHTHTPTHPPTPHTQIVNELYALAKTKPEWQAAAVKTINAMDLSALK